MTKFETLQNVVKTARSFVDADIKLIDAREKLAEQLTAHGFTEDNLRGTWTTYRRGELTNVERSMFWDAMFVSLSSVKIKGKRLNEIEVREIMSHFEAASRDNRKMYHGTPMGTIKDTVTWMGQATSFYTKSIKKMVAEPNDKKERTKSPAEVLVAKKLAEIEKILQSTNNIDGVDIPTMVQLVQEMKTKFKTK